jgi:hypothetical protein
MATYLKTDGTAQHLTPANGVHWSLEELQALVGGYIQELRTHDGHYLIVDEEGRLKHKQPNQAATALYLYGEYQILLGDAVVIETRLEMNGPDEDEDDGRDLVAELTEILTGDKVNATLKKKEDEDA